MKIKSSLKFSLSGDEVDSLIEICLAAYPQSLTNEAHALCESILDTFLEEDDENATESDCERTLN
jgi:hypothetical protein